MLKQLCTIALVALFFAGGPAVAQIEFMPEGAKSSPIKSKRTKSLPQKSTPPANAPSAAVTSLPSTTKTPSKPTKTAAPMDERPMQVSIVRSADPACEPDCAEWIAAQGRIDAGTLEQFKKVLKKLGDRQLTIFLDSSGGNVDASLAIGRLIRAKGLDVTVTRTEINACPVKEPRCQRAAAEGVKLGTPKAALSKCASACAFILAGGTHRLVSERTFVGVHRFVIHETMLERTFKLQPRPIWSGSAKPKKIMLSEKVVATRTRQAKPTDRSYASARKYLTEMGIDQKLMTLMLATPNSSIHLLTASELVSTRMATDFVDGEELVASGYAAQAAAAGLPSFAVEGGAGATGSLPSQ
jgi:hypothetical protein